MTSKLRKCFVGILLGYGIILVGLLYWQTYADLNKHSANPRYYQMFQAERGTIFDRHGETLAKSVEIDDKYVREYAVASLSHVVGYFHQRYGITGLENVLHDELIRGRQIYTTIDLQIQKIAQECLGSNIGAVVVFEPSNGEILALVSSPFVDGNLLDKNWSNYLEDMRSPFLNRATHGLYPPGSAIKPVVYGAAFREGIIDENQTWNDSGVLAIGDRTISNFGNRNLGKINIDEALAYSSNVVFAQLAIELDNSLLDYYRSFNLGNKVDFILNNQSGYVPEIVHSQYDAALLGIGQGDLLVTPLQMAMIASTIANHGIMMKPIIVKEIRGGLQMRKIARSEELGTVLPEEATRAIRRAMELATLDGTARSDAGAKLHIAAKTGTAQTGKGKDHAWFMGFAPSRSPRFAIAVVVEHGGTGATVATPIGTDIIAKILELVTERERYKVSDHDW
ncbi:MAG TPA: hypothetical protein GXZ55_10330 [Natronincola sp.]|nr:hypothetical protein [Natronincola sp.]